MVTAELGACEWFVYELRRSNLIDRGQLDQLVGEFLKRHPRADPQALAQHLITQGALTPFQAERVLTNKAQGLVLGPYVLTDALGAGSMGTVYRAVSKTDGKVYAVKVLPRRSMWNVRLARRQVRAFGQFNHAAVVPFVDVGTSGGMHYLVWPLVSGETLDAVVQRLGKLTPEQTAQVGVQVANGLLACHAQNLFHGLLKPSNIMVGEGLQVAILDFGIGSLLAENEGESLVDTMSTANTLTSGLDCASPESIMEPTNRTPAGDQYSLGCVLYYCLAGRYPFPEGSAVEKMMAHQFKAASPLKELVPDVPEALVAAVERLMAKKPEDRFGGTDEVAERLLPLAGGLPVVGAFDQPAPAASAPVAYAPRPSSFAPPPAPVPCRPSSFILPPPNGSSAGISSAQSNGSNHGLFPTPPPFQPRKSVAMQPPAAGNPRGGTAAEHPGPRQFEDRKAPSRHDSRGQAEGGPDFTMPPGFVPARPKAAQFGPLAIAVVGIGAMILSYIAFLSFNPFK
jgi:serine/threonine-protein kinase